MKLIERLMFFDITFAVSTIYQGECVADGVERVLNSEFLTNKEMTIEKCVNFCRNQGFLIAGVQWQTECYCGDRPKNKNNMFKWLWQNKCSLTCGGNSLQKCGGHNAMNVYSTIIESGSCIYDSPNNRALKDYAEAGLNGSKFFHYLYSITVI